MKLLQRRRVSNTQCHRVAVVALWWCSSYYLSWIIIIIIHSIILFFFQNGEPAVWAQMMSHARVLLVAPCCFDIWSTDCGFYNWLIWLVIQLNTTKPISIVIEMYKALLCVYIVDENKWAAASLLFLTGLRSSRFCHMTDVSLTCSIPVAILEFFLCLADVCVWCWTEDGRGSAGLHTPGRRWFASSERPSVSLDEQLPLRLVDHTGWPRVQNTKNIHFNLISFTIRRIM